MSLTDRLKSLQRKEWQRRPGLLLLPNVPKPMHGVVPRLILGRQWWDETRRAAYASTDWHCAACGVYKKNAEERPFLEGHEAYQTDYRKGRQTYVETVPLCHYCHCFIHDGRLEMLLRAGEIAQAKFDAVIAHGRAVLKTAGLIKKPPCDGPMAEWADWRLMLFGKEHPPLYKDYQEWLAAFDLAGEE